MAFGIDDAVTAASKLIDDAINRIWPDPQARASAEATTIKATADAAIATLQQQMSVMLAEAQSADKWTSRARPSFLYVMYVMILTALPYGMLSAFFPETARFAAAGAQAWLAAVPQGLWDLFQFVAGGYVGARTIEKIAPGVVQAVSRRTA